MYIQTLETPNPQTLKFVPDDALMAEGSAPVQFDNPESADVSPLASSLFALSDVTAVYVAQQFVSVTKVPSSDWEHLKIEVLTVLMDHFLSGKATMIGDKPQNNAESNENDSPVVKEIKAVINEKVRPAVAQDGGDIIFHGFDDGIVRLEMHGACAGCPSATVTLKQGIENMLKHYIPEVESVEAV